MKKLFIVAATLLAAGSFVPQVKADNYVFQIAGPGLSGTIDISYGAAADAVRAGADCR